jgi:cytochrome b561
MEPKTQLVYNATARGFHWITVAFVILLVPVGVYMAYRGGTLNIWDGVTNNLYSAHKLAGFTLLWIMVARLAYRLVKGAPADEPTLQPWQKVVAHATHWGLYGFLLAVPLAGWVAVSLYPSLGVFDLFNLPGIVSPNQQAAETALFVHKVLGWGLGLLIGAHVMGVLYHAVIRKDGVLRRMMPGRG